ncbi:MAG: hypothetical protein WC365_01410 [Candidatus Babeliales bacterium]
MAVKTKVDRSEYFSKDGYEYASVILRMRQDPIWFLREHCGVEPFPAQEEMIREFYRAKYNPTLPPYRHLVLALGMRSGKTAMSGMFGAIELMDICTISNPSKHYKLLKGQGIALLALATSLDQALEGVFGNTVNLLEGSEFVQTWMDFKFKSDTIECPDKNVFFKALGSWASTAVGRSAKAVFFDELDNFEDTTSKRGATEVYSRVIKATDTLGADGHTFALSSLKSPNGIMMNLCKDAEDQKRRLGNACNTLAYIRPTWEVNPFFNKETLMKEHENNLAAFWRDFGCQPSIWNALAFPNGVVLSKMDNVLLAPPASVINQPYRVMAIDPAVKKDAFGIACGYRHRSGKIIVDGVHRFQKKEGNIMIMPSEIKAYLNRVLPTLNVKVFLHDTWMYSDIIEEIIHKGIKTEQHIVNYDDYSTWLDLESSGKVTVVYDDVLRLECDKLIVTPGQKPKIDHPSAGSKDMADSVANCMRYINENKLNTLPKMTGYMGF